MSSDIAGAGKSMNPSICNRLTRMLLGRTERGTENDSEKPWRFPDIEPELKTCLG
jgi:hypothetical protein